MNKQGILLVNLGTPSAPTASGVKAFLKPFLSDPRVVGLPRLFWLPLLNGIILPLRSPKVAKAYQSIWLDDGSPLMSYSLKQKQALAGLLSEHHPDVSVELAMTYGEMGIAKGIRQLQQQGVEHIVVLPLYPQYSSTTTAPVFDQVAAFIQNNIDLPSLSLVRHYYDQPTYIDALAASIEAHWQAKGRSEKLLLSYHGIPAKLVEKGDVYARHCEQTTALLTARLGLSKDDVIHCYQSRFGKAEWLQPYTNVTLEAMAKEGVASVDVVCPAFAADCLETLEEMAVENRDVFLEAGGKGYQFIPCLNDNEAHIQALYDIARTYLR